MRKAITACILSLLVILPCKAQVQGRDSSIWRELVVPGALIGAGSIATALPWYRENVNLPVRDWVLSKGDAITSKADNYIQYLPYVMYIGGVAASLGKNEVLDQGLAVGTAVLFTAAVTGGLKELCGVLRPNGVDRKSFPSGHTATAFLGAELVRREFGPWWGLAAYTVAVTVGTMRVLNNWHWTSDVIAGAGMGILGATVGYALVPLEKRFLEKTFGRNNVSARAFPGVQMTSLGACASLNMSIRF